MQTGLSAYRNRFKTYFVVPHNRTNNEHRGVTVAGTAFDEVVHQLCLLSKKNVRDEKQAPEPLHVDRKEVEVAAGHRRDGNKWAKFTAGTGGGAAASAVTVDDAWQFPCCKSSRHIPQAERAAGEFVRRSGVIDRLNRYRLS